MSLDPTTFQNLVPSQFLSFTLPNPLRATSPILHTPLLRVAVLDSPSQPGDDSLLRIAAMVVPLHRESDWIFSTVSGHLQLILGSGSHISRLILIGNLPCGSHPTSYTCRSDSSPTSELEENLMPLVISLSPKLNKFQFDQIPFLIYDDGVVSSVVVDLCVGSWIGEMLVEDVELEICDEKDFKKTEFRRRLRFKRTPNLIQTQMRLSPDLNSRKTDFSAVSDNVDTAILVQPYLIPMVAGISLVGSHLEGKIRRGFRPRALCLGVGGGALITFLHTRLGFEVVGVEEDEVVLSIARRWFSLREDPNIHIRMGDGIEYVKKLAGVENENRLENDHEFGIYNFDVVMVDLDSSEPGIGSMAPVVEFVDESVLVAARSVLCESGIVVVNVIPSSRLSYEGLVCDFKKVFDELYEIDVGNGENFVLFASRTRTSICSSDCENAFLEKLREAISGEFMDSIRKL